MSRPEISKLKTLADRLNYAMNERGMSQGQLAKAANMAQPTIWRITSGNAKGTTKMFDLANALGVRPEWLADGRGPMMASTTPTPPQNEEFVGIKTWDSSTPVDDDEVEVPFLKDIEFACGDGRIGDEDYNGYKLRFSKATLRRIGASTDGHGILCFPARGDSMEPVIPDGTTVAINIEDKKIVDGKIYAISEDGWKRIKMLYRTGPDTVSIRSYNSIEHPPEEMPLSKIDIIGRVFWYSVLI
ncbi:MAG: XRE family transcriptional regulator [Kluyvera sp.]|uniref:XRE family transcriptional regulator n=1 Tax=Kluyvera sp. TaxID=1538228 RepID=UPI003F3F54E1